MSEVPNPNIALSPELSIFLNAGLVVEGAFPAVTELTVLGPVVPGEERTVETLLVEPQVLTEVPGFEGLVTVFIPEGGQLNL